MAPDSNVLIDQVDKAEDFDQIFYCVAEAFGRQARDSIWMIVNPGWDTPKGQQEGAAFFAKRWKSVTTDKDGKSNAIYLKATVPDPDNPTKRRIVGMAKWQQASFIDGYGDPPSDELGENFLKTLEPANARFATQMFRSLWKRRIAYTKEKIASDPPAIFVLDMCAVDPAFQRRGIAQKLVQWGLNEAKNRGLECTTEASSMGRGVYMKLGFQPEGTSDIVYEVDDEFKDWSKPPNLFLRTGITQKMDELSDR